MRHILLALVTFCCSLFSAQTFAQPTASWLLSSNNSSNNTYFYPGNGGMKTDSSGNSYLFGQVPIGTEQFGSLSLDSSSTSSWLYIAKIDPTGNPLWIKGITYTGGNVASKTIAVSESGYFSIGASFSDGTVTFDPTHTIATTNYDLYFVAGYDPDGNFLWVNSPDSSGSSQINGLFVSKNNATYCTGNFIGDLILDSVNYPSIEGTSVFLYKINKTGGVEWFRQGTTSDNAVALGQKVTVYNGVVYMAGLFNDSVTFGTNTVYGDNTSQIYLAKYDTAGNVQWAKLIGGAPGGVNLYGFGTDENYNVNMGGTVDQNGAVFGSDTIPGVGDSNGGFVVSCDSSGTFRWASAVFCPNGSVVNDLATGKIDGSTFVVGTTSGPELIVVGTAQPVDSITGSNRGFGFLLKFNSTGQLQWNKIFSGSEYITAQQVGLQEYQVVVAGTYQDSLTVDSLTINAGSSTQVYLCSFPLSPSTGIPELTQQVDWKVFPVPTGNKLIVQTGASVSSQLLVTDLEGRVLSRQIFNGTQTSLDITTYPAGVYIVTIQNGDGISSSRLVIKQ